MRRYVAIFAVLALSLIVLRPACDVLALDLAGAQSTSTILAHNDWGRSGFSPGGMHWSSLGTVTKAPEQRFAAPGFLIAVLSLAALLLDVPGTAWNAAPLPTRTYYSRSARILR